VHCFGLLYHLESPVAALRRLALEDSQTPVAELAELLSSADYDLFDISADAQLRRLESIDERHEDNLVAIPRESVRHG
jgi:hypothetical protein